MTFPPSRALGALAAFCLFHGSALQAQTVSEFDGCQISTPWAPGQGAFGRGVAGQLTPGAVRDAVQLCGTQAWVLLDADPRDAKVQLALDCLDLDVVPAGGIAGLDAVASVGIEGLRLTYFEAAAAGFETIAVAGGPWVGARLVRAIDVDGDGDADLVGVAADKRTLLAQGFLGGALAYASLSAGAAGADVRDLCAVQWDGDVGLELALLTDAGMEVRELDGTLRDAWTSVLPGGAIARLRQSGMATDRIAWITAYSPPALQYLMTLAPGGAVTDLVDLGALDAFSALGGDYDLDGDDDLLVSHHFSNELIWFENERTPAQPLVASFPTLDPDRKLFRVGPPGEGATLNQATPIVADLDGDADLDLLYAAQTSGTLELLRGETLDEEARKPQVLDGLWDPAASRLALDLQAPAAGLAGATHLQVNVWRRAGLNQPFEAQPVHHQDVELASGWVAALDLPLPEATAEFARIYSIELRLVCRDAAGTVLEARPPSVHYVAGNESNGNSLLSDAHTLGSQGIGTLASENSKIVLISRPKTSAFGGGFVPYL
jgi:hypothetical protein